MKAVREGIQSAHVGAGSQQRVRKPRMSELIEALDVHTIEWEVEDIRTVWIGLALSHLLMLRASKLFVGDRGDFHECTV